MKFFCHYLLLAILLMANIAQAQDEDSARRIGELSMSDEALQLKYLTTGDRFGVDNTDASLGVFLSEERDVVLSGGLLMDTQLLDWLNLQRLSMRVGTQGYAMLLGREDTDIVAISAGAELRFLLFPRRSVVITAYGYYAPDILTFGSADNVHDIGATIQAPLSERFTGFVGVRDFDVELFGNGTQLQSSIIVGVRYEY